MGVSALATTREQACHGGPAIGIEELMEIPSLESVHLIEADRDVAIPFVAFHGGVDDGIDGIPHHGDAGIAGELIQCWTAHRVNPPGTH